MNRTQLVHIREAFPEAQSASNPFAGEFLFYVNIESEVKNMPGG
ncbi:MAG: hypothetical protein M5U34_46165 [Chloroflexi bacterium]|nr:hypothetical protein [Chloroflexota bacterium]